MRVGSLRLVLRVAFLALVVSLLLSAGAPAASLPDYRCCFRLDTLMTGRLDTVFELPTAQNDNQQATWTFMTTELVVYDVTAGGPRLPRAWAPRRGGPAPGRGPGG